MLFKVAISELRHCITRFVPDRRGNIAMMFAILIAPLIAFVGAAIDYTRVSKARTAMQAALDSAALMIAKDNASGAMTQTQLNSKAQALFGALFTYPDAKNITITASQSYSAAAGSTLVLDSSGDLDTHFLRVAGFPTLSFGSSSTTTWGQTKLRLALALDNTGSMGWSGKIGALQSATRDLIDQMSATAQSPGDVYISIVPFGDAVNLGRSYVDANFIDWSIYGNGNHRSWSGCVRDRNKDFDVTVDPPDNAASRYPAYQAPACPAQIVPLSYDWANLKQTVNAMYPAGSTNQPIGLVWAWQTLQGSVPFNAPPEDSNMVTNKVIVLLSDGLNTESRWSQRESEIDARQRVLCDNIKKDVRMKIYTIQVNTDGDPESAVLKYCASIGEGGKPLFFATSTAAGIKKAFDEIAASLKKLRVAK